MSTWTGRASLFNVEVVVIVEALLGFAVGFFLGTKAGREGIQELRESWKVVSMSDEFKGLSTTAKSMAGIAMQQGVKVSMDVAKGNSGGVVSLVTDRLQTVLAGGSNGRRAA